MNIKDLIDGTGQVLTALFTTEAGEWKKLSAYFGHAAARPGPLHDLLRQSCTADFRARARGYGLEPADVQDWLVAFARGALYVQDRFDYMVKAIHLVDSATDRDSGQTVTEAIYYSAGLDAAIICWGTLKNAITQTKGRGAVFGNLQMHDRPHFTGMELATLLGVEETYHGVQHTKLRHLYTADDLKGPDMLNSSPEDLRRHYKTNRLETDAHIVILEAVDHFGFERRAEQEAAPRPDPQ